MPGHVRVRLRVPHDCQARRYEEVDAAVDEIGDGATVLGNQMSELLLTQGVAAEPAERELEPVER